MKYIIIYKVQTSTLNNANFIEIYWIKTIFIRKYIACCSLLVFRLLQAFKRALIFLIFLIFCQRPLFSLFKLQIPKNPLFFHENPNFTIIFSISKTSLAKKSKSSQIKLYIVYFQIVIVLNQCISVKTCCGYQHYSAWICVPYGYFEILNTRVDTCMIFYVICIWYFM